jgi:uncharacterized protein (TIGR00299 family) protein
MTLAFLDPYSGVSGDMLLGALVDSGLGVDALQQALTSLGVEGLRVTSNVVLRSGIGATKVEVEHPPQHEHRHLGHIVSLIEDSDLAGEVKERAVAVFLRLAEAEAAIHRIDVHQVHFHEAGAADAIADVVGTVFGLEQLGIDELLVGTVNVGAGMVHCAHGLLPVPAPATLSLLQGWDCCSAGPARELTTPTGAALVTTLGRHVPSLPAMTVGRVGYGAGGADPEGWPNLLRVVIGAPIESELTRAAHSHAHMSEHPHLQAAVTEDQ